MHVLLGIAVFAGLVGIAFGQNAARAFIGTSLVLLGLLFVAAVVMVANPPGTAGNEAIRHVFDMHSAELTKQP